MIDIRIPGILSVPDLIRKMDKEKGIGYLRSEAGQKFVDGLKQQHHPLYIVFSSHAVKHDNGERLFFADNTEHLQTNIMQYTGSEPFSIHDNSGKEMLTISPGEYFLAPHINENLNGLTQDSPLKKLKAIQKDFGVLREKIEDLPENALLSKNPVIFGVSHVARLFRRRDKMLAWPLPNASENPILKVMLDSSRAVSGAAGGQTDTEDLYVLCARASDM